MAVLVGLVSVVVLAVVACQSQATTVGVTRSARYVAMGSSFAAGPGLAPRQPGSPAGCGRSAHDYASRFAARRGLALTDVTCSGAKTAEILTTAQDGQRPQISAVTADTGLVTVTIGGNDVGYLGSLDNYSRRNRHGVHCQPVDRKAMNTALGRVRTRIGDVISAVHARAPRARVVVVDYFTVLPVGGVCRGVPLSAAQAGFERVVAGRLLSATRQAASAGHAALVDVATASIGHDACSATPWVEKYVAPAGRVSYHPTRAGMTAVATLIDQTLTQAPGGS